MGKKYPFFQLLIIALIIIVVGCSNNANKSPSAGEPNQGNPNVAHNGGEERQEVRYLEVWRDNVTSNMPTEKGSPYSDWLVEQTGIGIEAPVIPWDGGTAYLQRLNTRIAANNLPDLFLPWGGIEANLIQQGAIADLTDYLPVYAPHLWEAVPQEVWDIVRTADPSGQGRIYYIPKVEAYTYYCSYIRKDWLDNLGLEVPKTQEEYVNVMRAFVEQDANGNGDPNDEIAVSGREFGRWMDHLFGMYGVAMWEGLLMWDIYDGELTYSGVTPNMKAAIEWIRELYAEGLLDQETFLNSNDDWRAKMHSDRLGSWYHINQFQDARLNEIVKVNPDAELVALGVPKVEGYDGFITNLQLNRPQWVIANKDEQTIIDALTLLDWRTNPENKEIALLGVEGIHHEIVDGKPILLPTDPDATELKVITEVVGNLETALFTYELQYNSVSDPVTQRVFKNREQVTIDMQPYGKAIAGDGMPASIFEDYPDIRNHTLYQEYMTKIIIGDYDIDMFDEFVERWYRTGGEQVTEAARAWYEQINP